MKPYFTLPALLLLCLLLPACSTMQAVDEHTNFSPTSGLTVYRDQWVQRSPPEVHIEPIEQAAYAPSVLFIPFRVTQQMDSPGILGYSVARSVWQTWATMRIFPAMEFSVDDTPYRRDRALQLGRARGVNMVVGGFVTYVYPGGTAGDTQMSLLIEGIDTHSGQVVWSMAQSGLMPASKTNDYILFTTKNRMPSDPLHAIAQVIGIDTGKVLQDWISGSAPLTDGQKRDNAVRDALYGPRDVPAPRKADGQDGAKEKDAF